MEFYLVKNENLYSGCIGELMWAMVSVNFNEKKEHLIGNSQPAQFYKVWTRLADCCNSKKNAVILQVEFDLPCTEAEQLEQAAQLEEAEQGAFWPDRQQYLQIGICTSKITDALVKLFGEEQIQLEVQLTNLYQGEIKLNDIIFPELVLVGNRWDKFACESWGTFSYMDGIDFIDIPVLKGDITMKVIVTKSGLDKFETDCNKEI